MAAWKAWTGRPRCRAPVRGDFCGKIEREACVSVERKACVSVEREACVSVERGACVSVERGATIVLTAQRVRLPACGAPSTSAVHSSLAAAVA